MTALEIGVVLEAFADRSLPEALDWLVQAAPEVTQVEIGSGGYAPRTHCDLSTLLTDTASASAGRPRSSRAD